MLLISERSYTLESYDQFAKQESWKFVLPNVLNLPKPAQENNHQPTDKKILPNNQFSTADNIKQI